MTAADSEVYESETGRVAAFAAHPNLSLALRKLATGALEIYRRRPILNLVLNDRGRMAVSHIALHLHYSTDPSDPTSGLTTNRFKQVCAQAGLGSPGRAAAALALLRFGGLLTPAATTQRGQRQRLVPTETFLELQRERMGLGFTALSYLTPQGEIALNRLHDQDFIANFTRELGETLRTSVRPLDRVPKMRFFFDRNGGMMVLLSLLLSGDPDDTIPPVRPIAVSVAALAKRFAVSRIHVTRVLASAEEEGLLQRSAPDSNLYQFTPALREAVVMFGAAVLGVLAQSVAAALQPRRQSRSQAA